jgi:hypothetical protein
MKKSRALEGFVRLNGAAFRLSTDEIRAGNLDALVDSALARVTTGGGGGATTESCTQYTCNLFVLSPPPSS